MNQARLCLLQLAECRLGSVARRANGFFSLLSLGDVGVDQHKAAARNRIAAHFNDAAVGPSRLLKKSGAFADEARVVTVVDIELPNEATRGADHSPSATAGGVILVVPFP